MTSESVTAVSSPFQILSGRKRHLSLPEKGSVKILKSDGESVRDIRKARRVIYSRQTESRMFIKKAILQKTERLVQKLRNQKL